MALKKLLLATFIFLFIGSLSYGQSTSSSQQLIESIQSIAKSKGLEKAKVNFFATSDFGGSIDMDLTALTHIREFRFEGQFLVIDDSYFNLDKLLYFTPKKDHIDFFFQIY